MNTPAPKRLKRRKRTKKEDQSRDYVNNKEFYNFLVEFKKNGGSEQNQVTPELTNAITQVCTRLSGSWNFRDYSYKDDMISDAILNCIEKIDKFDINHPTRNPFAYFTQTAWNAFIRRIKVEKKEADIKQKALINYSLGANISKFEDGDKLDPYGMN